MARCQAAATVMWNAEHPGEDGGRQVGRELEQGGGAGLARAEPSQQTYGPQPVSHTVIRKYTTPVVRFWAGNACGDWPVPRQFHGTRQRIPIASKRTVDTSITSPAQGLPNMLFVQVKRRVGIR